MKKKLTALLTALTMTASMGAVSVSACDCFDEMTFVNGNPVYETKSYFGHCLIVETDGTELTKDMFTGVDGVADVESFTGTPEFKAWGVQEFDFSTEKTAFIVYFDETMEREPLINSARAFHLQIPCIEDVHTVNAINRQRLSYSRSFYVRFKESDIDEKPDVSKFEELADFKIDEVSYSNADGCYQCLVDTSEQWSTLKESGMKYWEIHKMLCEMVDTLNVKYGGEFTAYNPEVCPLDTAELKNGNASSVWTSAGDSNSDGAVDASDAANVLNIAAQNGTGANIKATAADDVNADGAVNAADAAAVLCYAAAKGTGADVSWVDILRR